MGWIDCLENSESLKSLYRESPDLTNIELLKFETNFINKAIHIEFRLSQLPDMIPRRGVWAKVKNPVGVFIFLHFTWVENYSATDILPGQYGLRVEKNKNYREILGVSTENPYDMWLETYDKFNVELKNDNSHAVFTTVMIHVHCLRPFEDGADLAIKPGRPPLHKKGNK